MFKNLIYKVIYNPFINFFIRHSLKPFANILPDSLKLPVSGKINYKINNNDKLKLLTNETSYITKLFFWEGIENYEYTPLFIKLIRKFDSFVDIGANIGYYSVLAGKLNNKMKIYA